MTIDNKLVERIAKLSRISLTETEVKNLTSELGNIMDFEHTKKTKDLMSIVADFINTHIKPAESIYAEEMKTYRREGEQWRVPKILYELKEKAKGAGLWPLLS